MDEQQERPDFRHYPTDDEWAHELAWREVEKRLQWRFDVNVIENSSGARADLNILSQVTPLVVTSPQRDYEWLAEHAMRSGAKRISYNTIDWPIHGNCQNRYTQTFKAAPFRDANGRKTKRTYTLYIDIHTRCRKCQNCARFRAALWRYRANAEYQRSVRTWFGTLTLSQARQSHFRYVAIQRATREKLKFEALPEDKQFARIYAAISKELTKGLKRLRKNTGVPFKYLIVAEAHKSGQPHVHFLFHEQNANKPLRYAEMKKYLWKEGFSNFKLVLEGRDDPTYLCKYLSKSLLARVRASQGYGCVTTYNSLKIGMGHSVITTTPKKKTIF